MVDKPPFLCYNMYMKKQKINYYEQINNAIKSYEDCKPYHKYSIEWITDRIDWCWKFRKISSEQLTELSNRIINIMNGE